MTNKITIMANEMLSLGKKERSIREYSTIASRFINTLGDKDEYSRKDIINYLNIRRKNGVNGNSLRQEFYAIKKLLKSNQISWDNDLKPPKISGLLSRTKVFNPKLIEKMIKTVIELNDIRYMSYIALATTYGMRRTELSRVRNDDFDFKNKIFNKFIAKYHDEKRPSLIPDEIINILKEMDFDSFALNESKLSYIIRIIESKGHIPHLFFRSWHSIRRTVITILRINGVSPSFIVDFIGWGGGVEEANLLGFDSIKSSQAKMLDLYTEVSGMFKTKEVDSVIFKNHPFLPIWQGKSMNINMNLSSENDDQ